MTRNLRTIIIMAVGIVLLAAALFALTCDGCADDGLLSPSDAPAVSDSHSHTVSELSGMHLHKNETGELLVEGGELESLRLISDKGDYFIHRGEDGKLTIDSLSGLLLETDFIELTWYNAHSFGYSYSMYSEDGSPVKLADYGLDPVRLTVECRYADGSFCRLFVGNQVTGSPSIYYFMLEGRNEVFLNEFDASFFEGDSYWLDEDIFGDDGDEVTIGAIRLTGGAFPQETVLQPHQSGDKSDPYYGCKYVFTQPIACRADDYLITLLTDELTELVADETVLAFPDEAQLAQYGLDRPDAIVTHLRNGAAHTLRVSKHDASTLYVIADGVDCIFMLSADSFPMLASLTPDLLRAPEIHVRYFDSVESIRITAGSEDYLFRMERTPLETDNTLYEYRAFCGETQLTLNYYKNLLEIFNSATAVSYDGRNESDSPAVTVTVSYFDEFERDEDVIRYYPAGTRRYTVELDGQTGIVVSQMWLDKLVSSARLLSENQAVTP